jgi:hypothetical protein
MHINKKVINQKPKSPEVSKSSCDWIDACQTLTFPVSTYKNGIIFVNSKKFGYSMTQ